MPIHDWTGVDAGLFHAFHTAWITHLSESMNGGLLPAGYYALPEQHFGRSIADVLTLHAPGLGGAPSTADGGGLAVAEAPPKVSRKATASAAPRSNQRTLAIRHVSDHRVVAIVEIVSPANKDRRKHVDELTAKIVSSLTLGIHVLLADLFAPGPHDPHAMHGAIWEIIDPDATAFDLQMEAPLLASAYVAGPEIETYFEPMAVGDELPEMPLFLTPERYVNVPLEKSYDAAYRGLPAYWRAAVKGLNAGND